MTQPGASPLHPSPVSSITQEQVSSGGSKKSAPSGSEDIKLSEVWRSIRRRQRLILVVWSSTFVVSILITAHQRYFLPVYQGRFDLLISDPVGGGARQGGGSDSSDSFRQLALNRTSTDLPTLFQVLRSQSLLESLASRHNLSAGALAARISVSTAGDSRNPADGVLKVALSGRNPQLDQKLLEELADAYLNYSLSQRQERLTAGLRFLDRQAPLLMSRANELSLQLARFRRTHNLLEPLVEGAAIRQLSGAAEQSIRSLQAERSRLLVARRGVVDGTLSARGFQEAIGTGSGGGASGGSGGGGLSIAGSSQGVLEQVGKLDDQIGEARSRYNPDSPMLQGLVERRRALLPLLRRNQLEAIDTALALNADRIEEARTQKAGIDQRFQQQPQLIREYDELQQKLNLALENLSGLRQAKENFSLELAQRTVPWRLIARPSVNPQPISPSVPRNLAMGLGLGLVAGVGAGLLRDRLDHVFHTPADAREDLQRPLLGHVPHVEFFQGVRENNRFLIEELDQNLKPLPDGTTGGDVSKEDQKLSGYQRFFYQEAFRNLFTSIRFLKTEKPLRSIAITSSLPNEGKSLVNVLLAKTLSEMGQRVLVVDADLRKPQMHYRLGFNNLLGLTNLLTEDHLRWQDLIQPVAGYENWSVLTSGRQPPDPARLLSSRRMKELVRELAESNQFDLILYDTPPVLGLADAALVSEHLDGLLLLVSLNRVDRDLPKEAISRITSSGVALLGIVTNAISPERLLRGGAYGYGYGRYGRYGYYGYNSGYSSYDPRNAYLYYQPGQDSEPPSAREEKPAAGTVRERAARLRRRLIRWIDQ